ncbi:hypothetical protein Tco_1329619 [Tanacetum coccineum]
MSMWIISRGVVLLILLMEYKFQVGYNGFTSHVITTIADRIRDKDTSQSKQNLQSSSMTFIHKTLIIPSVLDSCFISSTVSEVKRGCWFGGKPIQKLRQKGVYEESFSRHAAWIGGKLIQLMHTTMVQEQVKTMKIQAGIQVLRRGELRRQLQLRMIPEPGDPDREVLVAKTFHEQTDEELVEKEVKQMKADDQAIRNILIGLYEDIYAVDNGQAMIDADYELAARLQAQEQEELTVEEKSKLFKVFDKTMGWIDSFVSMDSEVVKGERIKKQKIDDDQEEAEMKKHMEIIVDEEEITLDAIPLATKTPIIKVMYGEIYKDTRSRILEVFEYILLVKIKLLNKKLEDSEDEHQVWGKIVGIKILHDDLGVNTTNLVLLE